MDYINLADPELELIDPTPNVHALFLQFDKIFFWSTLSSRTVVRWSKRMYSCAGICTYDRGGLCDIALSEPLLKLRPRKDLVETLLHEMIHAFLFVTKKDQDRDGHGPNFKAHMYRINKAAGLNISIYHDFHDEVNLYLTHWWRCDGPCQKLKPYFGIVRRSCNRAPGPHDYWWNDHKRKCGGNFIKIKEPEKIVKTKENKKANNGDITKYINNKSKAIDNKSNGVIQISWPVLKDSNFNEPKHKNNNLVVSKKNIVIFNPQKPKSIDNNRHLASNDSKLHNKSDVVNTVRNIWANKTLPGLNDPNGSLSVRKRKSLTEIKESTNSPSKKIKIDDYFKTTASNLLKGIYGQDFSVKKSENTNKLIAVPTKTDNFVNCPVCNIRIRSDDVNQHLDECLNKETIESMDTNLGDNAKTEDFVDLTHIQMSKINENNSKTKIAIESIKNQTLVKDLTNLVSSNSLEFVKIDRKGDELSKKNKNMLDTSKNIGKVNDGVVNILNIETDAAFKDEIEAGSSKQNDQIYPCCGAIATKPLDEHFDECLTFFDDSSIPQEASTSFTNETIVINDDHDESAIFNETGTKYPCPCCIKMIEAADMNDHLDVCLGSTRAED